MNVFAVLLTVWFLLAELTTSTRATASHRRTALKDGKALDASVNGTKHSYQEIPNRRTISPDSSCYKPFFANNQPPIGFPAGLRIKYICQRDHPNGLTYYATMFDKENGIAIYSGYAVENAGISLNHYTGDFKWSQNLGEGLPRQGSDAMYSSYNGQDPIDKGHLAPAALFSFDKDRKRSTYKYTNAVPQYSNFNRGQWKAYETRIRDYAKSTCKGKLYLLTGTSEYWHPVGRQKMFYFPKYHYQGRIRIPISMWTAGCCIGSLFNQEIIGGAFALIGNNNQLEANNRVRKVTVEKLQEYLDIGVGNTGATRIKLFPGKPACADPKFDAFLVSDLRTITYQ